MNKVVVAVVHQGKGVTGKMGCLLGQQVGRLPTSPGHIPPSDAHLAVAVVIEKDHRVAVEEEAVPLGPLAFHHHLIAPQRGAVAQVGEVKEVDSVLAGLIVVAHRQKAVREVVVGEVFQLADGLVQRGDVPAGLRSLANGDPVDALLGVLHPDQAAPVRADYQALDDDLSRRVVHLQHVAFELGVSAVRSSVEQRLPQVGDQDFVSAREVQQSGGPVQGEEASVRRFQRGERQSVCQQFCWLTCLQKTKSRKEWLGDVIQNRSTNFTYDLSSGKMFTVPLFLLSHTATTELN